MKKKLMSLLLCSVLAASTALPATVYGEEFFSAEEVTDSGEDSRDEGNPSLEESEYGWEESKESQQETEFEDAGFGDLQEGTENFEEITGEEDAQSTWEDTDEVEITDLDASGSGYASASLLKTNTTYSTRLTDSVKERWFKYTIPSDGNLSLSFSHDYLESSSTYWIATIYTDGGEKQLASYDLKGNETTYSGKKFGAARGTYYIKITPYNLSDTYFKFRLNYNAANNWEKEVNDNPGQENEIRTNSLYYGSLQRYGDADWYKVSIPNDGSLSIDFSHGYLESTYPYWQIDIYNSLYQKMEKDDTEGNQTTFNGKRFGAKAGTYYIKVYHYNYSDLEYSFRVNYTASKIWEKEFNDDYGNATPISMNVAYYGSLQNGRSDVDWYQFRVPSAGSYELSFTHDYIESESTYWQATVFDSAFHEKGRFDYIGNRKISSNKIELSSGGVYYIKVGYWCWSGSVYSLKVTSHTHVYTTEITKATLYQDGKYTQKCSCGYVRGTGTIYRPSRVALSTNTFVYNGYSQIPQATVYDSRSQVISSANYTVVYDKDTKSIGSHQVTIQFKGNYSGSLTSSYVINPKGTSVKSLSKLSRGFIVKWRKSSTVTGYQIQYSTKKSFKGSSTITIGKRTTASRRVKYLRGKKKYYVRIRTYKNVGWTTYYSTWSAAKAVTTKR